MAGRKKAEVLNLPQAQQVAIDAKGGESIVTQPEMRPAEKMGPASAVIATQPFTGPRAVIGRVKAHTRPGTLGGLTVPNAARGASAYTRPSAFDHWNPGLHALSGEKRPNVITMTDVIGEDYWTGGGVTSKSVSAQLNALGSEADIEVHVNSPGGDMFEGIAIYNLLAMHRGRITVKVLGLAASAASVITMAGDEVQMGDASFIMIHDCWVMAAGNRHGFLETASWLEPFDRAMAGLYAKRTGRSEEEMLAAMDKDGGEGTYFSAREAIDIGLADSGLDEAVTESAQAKEQGKVKSNLLKTELALCSTMPRSKARELLSSIKGPVSKPDAAAPQAPALVAKPDAGDAAPSWIGAASDLLSALRR